MSWPSILGIALALAMDALAVSIAAGIVLPKVTPRHVFRLAFHFGLFQAMMPVLGYWAGRGLVRYLEAVDHWIAFGLLALVGSKMFVDAFRADTERSRADPTRGLMLITLSLATSIDALAVGLTMAFLGISIWLPAVVIGLVAAAMTFLGLRFGAGLGSRVGRWAEVAGGCVLWIIGLKVLASHLLA